MMVGDENDKRNDEKECKNGNDGDGNNEGDNDDDAFTFTTSTLSSSYYIQPLLYLIITIFACIPTDHHQWMMTMTLLRFPVRHHQLSYKWQPSVAPDCFPFHDDDDDDDDSDYDGDDDGGGDYDQDGDIDDDSQN